MALRAERLDMAAMGMGSISGKVSVVEFFPWLWVSFPEMIRT